METVKRYLRIILNIVIPLFSIGLICVLGPKMLRFFMPFVIGGIIAMIANPLVRFLERRLKIVRKHGSVLIIIVALAAVMGILYLLISKILVEASGLLSDLPSLYENVQNEAQLVVQRLEHLFAMLPPNMQDTIAQFTENMGQYISTAVQKMAFPTASVAGNFAKGIPSALVYTVVTIISAYLFIAERDNIIFYSRRYMPQSMTRYMVFLKEDVRHLMGGYFLAQFRIMFVVAAILVAGFIFLQVKYGLILAVLVSIVDFLPIFGTGTILLPWAVLKLISGEYFMASGLALLYVLTQVVRQIIQPKIVGDSLGVPPMVTLFLLYLGFKLSGLSGMILAVPVGMLAINLYHFGVFDSMVENMKLLVHEINKFRTERDR